MRLQVWHLFVLMMFIAMVAVVAVLIIAAVRSSQRGTPPAVGTGPYPTPSPGPIDPEKRLAALRELAQMRKAGLLTEEEYQAEVRRLG